MRPPPPSVLGLSRLQRLRLRGRRDAVAKMHGRAGAPARARQHHQLPLVEDAETRHEPEEAEIAGEGVERGPV